MYCFHDVTRGLCNSERWVSEVVGRSFLREASHVCAGPWGLCSKTWVESCPVCIGWIFWSAQSDYSEKWFSVQTQVLMSQIFLGFTLHKNHITVPQAGYTGNCCPIVPWLNSVDPLCVSAPNYRGHLPRKKACLGVAVASTRTSRCEGKWKPAQDFFWLVHSWGSIWAGNYHPSSSYYCYSTFHKKQTMSLKGFLRNTASKHSEVLRCGWFSKVTCFGTPRLPASPQGLWGWVDGCSDCCGVDGQCAGRPEDPPGGLGANSYGQIQFGETDTFRSRKIVSGDFGSPSEFRKICWSWNLKKHLVVLKLGWKSFGDLDMYCFFLVKWTSSKSDSFWQVSRWSSFNLRGGTHWEAYNRST